jgi:hypothetical protein
MPDSTPEMQTIVRLLIEFETILLENGVVENVITKAQPSPGSSVRICSPVSIS